MNCQTEKCVFILECNKEKCKQRYRNRIFLSEHRGYITGLFPTQGTGIHFNQSGQSVSDVSITILEKSNKEIPHKQIEYTLHSFIEFVTID